MRPLSLSHPRERRIVALWLAAVPFTGDWRTAADSLSDLAQLVRAGKPLPELWSCWTRAEALAYCTLGAAHYGHRARCARRAAAY